MVGVYGFGVEREALFWEPCFMIIVDVMWGVRDEMRATNKAFKHRTLALDPGNVKALYVYV